MRALNETSEAQQAGDTIVPDRAAIRRNVSLLPGVARAARTAYVS